MVERSFGELKHEWALLPLPVRRLARVALHVDLTILTRLAFALIVTRALPPIAKRVHASHPAQPRRGTAMHTYRNRLHRATSACPLASRAVIDQALGILMAQQGCDADAAFGLLRAASQHRNRKLRDIAADIVAAVSGQPPRPGSFHEPN